MLRSTGLCLSHGQFQDRLKTRMVGYIPKVVPRKIKGALISLRAESNTGFFLGRVKNAQERTDNSGKRLQKVIFDPIIGRYVVGKETKIKPAQLTKNHIQKKVNTPF
jgi:hypothetical protein